MIRKGWSKIILGKILFTVQRRACVELLTVTSELRWVRIRKRGSGGGGEERPLGQHRLNRLWAGFDDHDEGIDDPDDNSR